MATVGRWFRNALTRSASAPRKFPTGGFKVIAECEKLEGDNWEWYKPGHFYPVRIGEVFQSRCEVLGKHGYGSRSTA